jgi:hypothetical protein
MGSFTLPLYNVVLYVTLKALSDNYFCSLVLSGLGLELKALRLLGRCFTTCVTLPVLLCSLLNQQPFLLCLTTPINIFTFSSTYSFKAMPWPQKIPVTTVSSSSHHSGFWFFGDFWERLNSDPLTFYASTLLFDPHPQVFLPLVFHMFS